MSIREIKACSAHHHNTKVSFCVLGTPFIDIFHQNTIYISCFTIVCVLDIAVLTAQSVKHMLLGFS
jgi:hypothetical protein